MKYAIGSIISQLKNKSKYRGKGLAKKLIAKHFQDNQNKMVCLNTRRTNTSAISLYESMGYSQVAHILNTYFQPTEDSVFMVKKN